jgi:hypothetical protein
VRGREARLRCLRVCDTALFCFPVKLRLSVPILADTIPGSCTRSYAVSAPQHVQASGRPMLPADEAIRDARQDDGAFSLSETAGQTYGNLSIQLPLAVGWWLDSHGHTREQRWPTRGVVATTGWMVVPILKTRANRCQTSHLSSSRSDSDILEVVGRPMCRSSKVLAPPIRVLRIDSRPPRDARHHRHGICLCPDVHSTPNPEHHDWTVDPQSPMKSPSARLPARGSCDRCFTAETRFHHAVNRTESIPS